MRNFLTLLTGLCLVSLLQAAPATGQNLRNDGFHRRNGQMHVLRNGQLRPMTRDARLPTGAVVTKDGFIRSVNGTRTELREGQGCDLKGNIVAIVPAAAGGLALGSPTRGQSRSTTPTVVRLTLEDLIGNEQDDDYDEDQGKQEKEWQKEARKQREEYTREQSKKWKHKGKKGKGSDD